MILKKQSHSRAIQEKLPHINPEHNHHHHLYLVNGAPQRQAVTLIERENCLDQ